MKRLRSTARSWRLTKLYRYGVVKLGSLPGLKRVCPKAPFARKDAGLKRLFETLHKRCVAVAELDEPGQVVVRVERILPGERLVVVVAPVAAAARQRVLGQEARRVSRADEAAEAQRSHVGVPVVAPIVGAVKVSLKLGVLAQTCRNGGERKVVDRTITKVFSRAHQARVTPWQNSLFHRTADGS